MAGVVEEVLDGYSQSDERAEGAVAVPRRQE
jgi:hypothetical protein